jgi:hypothetical protein
MADMATRTTISCWRGAWQSTGNGGRRKGGNGGVGEGAGEVASDQWAPLVSDSGAFKGLVGGLAVGWMGRAWVREARRT